MCSVESTLFSCQHYLDSRVTKSALYPPYLLPRKATSSPSISPQQLCTSVMASQKSLPAGGSSSDLRVACVISLLTSQTRIAVFQMMTSRQVLIWWSMWHSQNLRIQLALAQAQSWLDELMRLLWVRIQLLEGLFRSTATNLTPSVASSLPSTSVISMSKVSLLLSPKLEMDILLASTSQEVSLKRQVTITLCVLFCSSKQSSSLTNRFTKLFSSETQELSTVQPSRSVISFTNSSYRSEWQKKQDREGEQKDEL